MSCLEAPISHNLTLENQIVHELQMHFTGNAHAHPVVILIGGFQGSGKSSLIERIRTIYPMNVISTDVIRQSLFDRGVSVSPTFSKSVHDIYLRLLGESLSAHANTVVDANAHSKRIEEIEKILATQHPHYPLIKILLNASEETLRERVRSRTPTPHTYSGTESDLESSLASIQLDPAHYSLVVETDAMSMKEVFERVNAFITPYFTILPPQKGILDLMPKEADPSFSGFINMTLDQFAQLSPSDEITKEPMKQIYKEHEIITALDREWLEPTRRPFIEGIDRSPEHLPYHHNQFALPNGDLVSASHIALSSIDPTCPNMIAAQGPMPHTIERFWSMVASSNSHLIVMLTDFLDQKGKAKCTRYWPENSGETLHLGEIGSVTLMSHQRILHDGKEELWHAELQLTIGEATRTIQHYWLKGWQDGEMLKSLTLYKALLEQMHQHIVGNLDDPPIIHCSGGVGRTGIVIGSYLAQHLLTWSTHQNKFKKEDLPLHITLFLRCQRSHLLHTLDQYRGLSQFILSPIGLIEKNAETGSRRDVV